MKNLFLLLSIVGFFQVHGITKEQFKETLYRRQFDFMEEKQYKSVLEPYLDEEYRTLTVMRYCFDNDTEFSKRYISSLIEYHLAVFYLIKDKRDQYQAVIYLIMARQNMEYHKDDLLKMIKEYQATIDPSVNIKEEFEKTAALFKRANKNLYAYYERYVTNLRKRKN